MHWVIDGNNVYGSRPDGWWNDRDAAAERFAQRVAEWCRTHGDHVLLVFDGPVEARVLDLAGGNLEIEASSRRGRDAADHHIVAHVSALDDPDRADDDRDADRDADRDVDPDDDRDRGPDPDPDPDPDGLSVDEITVVTSDKGLRARLPAHVRVLGAGRFRDLITY